MPQEVEVVVIGAGLSGLAATKALMAQNKSVALLEARNRIGGRAFTDIDTFGVPFDHGCSWVQSVEANPLKSIIKNYNFDLLEDYEFDIYMCKNIASEEDKSKFEKNCEELKTLIENTNNDVQLSKILSKTNDPYNKLAADILAFVNGVDVDTVSTQALLEEECSPGHKLIKQGLGTFVARYGRDIPTKLNTTVTEIDYTNKTIVTTTNNGQIKTNKVLITVPIGVLLNEKIKFTPALPLSKQEGINGFQMGCFNKIALMFDSKLSDQENHYTLIADDEQPLIGASLNSYGSSLAITFIAGRFAQELEKEGEQASVDYILERLSTVFGSKIKKMYKKGFATSWMQSEFSYGSYSTPIPGKSHMRARLMEPIENRIFFSGEACNKQWMGQLAGAYLSGIESAKLILKSQ